MREVEFEVFREIVEGFEIQEYAHIDLNKYTQLFTDIHSGILEFCQHNSELVLKIKSISQQVIKHQTPELANNEYFSWILTIAFLKSLKQGDYKKGEQVVSGMQLPELLTSSVDNLNETASGVSETSEQFMEQSNSGFDNFIIDETANKYSDNNQLTEFCSFENEDNDSVMITQKSNKNKKSNSLDRGVDERCLQGDEVIHNTHSFKNKFEWYLLLFEVYASVYNTFLEQRAYRRIVELFLQLAEGCGVCWCVSNLVYKSGGYVRYTSLVFPREFSSITQDLLVLPHRSVTINFAKKVFRYGGCSGGVTYLVVQNKYSTEQSDINPDAISQLDNVKHMVNQNMVGVFREEILNKYGIDIGSERAADHNRKLWAEKVTLVKDKVLVGEESIQKLKKQLQKTLNFEYYSRQYILQKSAKNIQCAKNQIEVKKNIDIFKKILDSWSQDRENPIPQSLAVLHQELLLLDKGPFLKKLKTITWSCEITKEFSSIKDYYYRLHKWKNEKKTLKVEWSRLIAKSLKLETWIVIYKYLKSIDAKQGGCFQLQHYYDFRGRLYSKSPLSIINTKWLRSIYVYETLETHEDFDNVKKRTFETQAYSKIKTQFYKLEIGPFTHVTCDYIKQMIIWCLIDLAKNFKSKLIKNGQVVLDDFVDYGLSLYNTHLMENKINTDGLEIYEILEFRKIIHILNELRDSALTQNYFLCKDSTASVLQHLFKFLGVKDTAALVMCNITSDCAWVDPYTTILTDFFKWNSVQDNNKKYFTRKSLKKVIMTFHYSVSFRQAFNYFLEANFNELNTPPVFGLIDDFKKFFNYLRENHETNLFYKKPSETLVQNPQNVEYIDGSVIALKYYAHTIKKLEVKNKREQIRKTYNTIEIVPGKLDDQKTKRAYRANLIHSHDSVYLRQLLLNLTMLTVHDMFAIPIGQVCIFLDRANNTFRQKLIANDVWGHQEEKLLLSGYSLFIIL